MPDLSALSRRDQVTYWIGSVTRGLTAVEVFMRRSLRDIGGGTWEERLDGEPGNIEQLRKVFKAAVKNAAALEPHASDVVQLLGEVARVNKERVTLVHSLWIELSGEDRFRQAGPSMMQVAPDRQLDDFQRVAHDVEVVVARTQWLSSVINTTVSGWVENPLLPFGWAMVRGEFTLMEDGGLDPHDPVFREDPLGGTR